jgi:hypothetical protein
LTGPRNLPAAAAAAAAALKAAGTAASGAGVDLTALLHDHERCTNSKKTKQFTFDARFLN